MAIITNTEKQQVLQQLIVEFGEEKIAPLVKSHHKWLQKHPEGTIAAWSKAMSLEALSFLDEQEPFWTFVAARIYLAEVYSQQAERRGTTADAVYTKFAENVRILSKKGIYNPSIMESYSNEELEQLGNLLVAKRDSLFTYIALKTLLDRYVAKDFNKDIVELPQERWLVIAMTLMKDEKENRLEKIKEAYWAMSNLYMTVATPTLSNAGKPHGQLSSCFIDTVDDSLQGIYDSNTDVATLSKFGGGIGVYMGKVRSRGSSIRGFVGASSGVLPWIKQLNNTAVSVDQLGQRQGAVAVYLDAWHKDIFTFLDLRLNNGDDRLRAHDIFTGICLPDLFMERVDAREE